MVFVLFLVVLALNTSWEQIMTEKSLTDILDYIIDETNATTENGHRNNSKIIYLNPSNSTRRAYANSFESKLDSLHSNQYEDFDDLVHKLQDTKHATDRPGLISRDKHMHSDNSIKIEEDGLSSEIKYRSNAELPKSTIQLPQKAPQNKDNNLIHSTSFLSDVLPDYLEVINNNYSLTKNNELNDLAHKVNDPVGAVLKILNEASKKRTSNELLHDLEPILSSYSRNPFENNLMNTVPVAYRDVSQHEKMLLGKLPARYRGLHHIIHRSRSPYLDPNLQLNRWGGNAEQNSLMSISRAHKMSRVHFIPKPRNGFLPRILYQPLYRYHI